MRHKVRHKVRSVFFWGGANFQCLSAQSSTPVKSMNFSRCQTEKPHATRTEIYFPNPGGEGVGGLGGGSCFLAGWCSELPQRVCAAAAKRKRAIRTHIYEGLSGLMTSDVKERSDEILPHPPIQSARWRKRQAGPTLTGRKASESGENKIRGKKEKGREEESQTSESAVNLPRGVLRGFHSH